MDPGERQRRHCGNYRSRAGIAPASGKVVEINESLNQGPEAVNQDAHKAWMIKLELSNPGQVDALMSADDYEKYVAEEK